MKNTILVLLMVSLAGCATTPSPELEAKRQQVAATIPTCKSDKECEVKWSAARQWVLNNSGYRFQNMTPDYMETYNSTDASVDLAARVIKTPQSDGSYRIEASVWCANIYGCRIEPWDALIQFNQSVTASWKP